MTPFQPDGEYNSIPYRVLLDSSIEAMLPHGLVKFKDMGQLVKSLANAPANTDMIHSTLSCDALAIPNGQTANVLASARPRDYYSTLLEAISATKQNSAQLRALVYERVRFNLKRDALFGYSSIGLSDLVHEINEFELAVARIEANAVDDEGSPAYPDRNESLGTSYAKVSNAVQILPPRPIAPLYAGLNPIQWIGNFQYARLSEEFARNILSAKKFIGFALFGLAFIGTMVIIVMLWHFRGVSPKIEIVNNSKIDEAAVKQNNLSENAAALKDSSSKSSFPLPKSFGVYILSNNNLTELEALPINIPDQRIALSAEIKTPSATTVSDSRPAFILFRRDLLNNAPPKILVRVIARMARETKIVGGKAGVTNIEGAWRIRNISRELKISPIANEREMVIARVDDDVELASGRYALVLNRIGYDFTIKGAVQSPAFCLEAFETSNGSVFTQCRSP